MIATPDERLRAIERATQRQKRTIIGAPTRMSPRTNR
jgi:hypothetical protein